MSNRDATLEFHRSCPITETPLKKFKNKKNNINMVFKDQNVTMMSIKMKNKLQMLKYKLKIVLKFNKTILILKRS